MHTSFRAEDLTSPQAYDLMANLIVPRPIAFVSTLSREGRRNLAPFSYFMPGGTNPPSLCFCPILAGGGRKKDTLVNIEETGEFVVNLVDRTMAEGMNATSGMYPHDTDEWPMSGFNPVDCLAVRPARVLESPASFECKLHQVAFCGDQAGGGSFVIGEILAIHVRPELLLPEARFLPISRLGGPDYLDLASVETFGMERPKA
jgi:flavin reductase (DIM6/NTAB) family NADH-FMN oxidoreductase RutF